jgi:hypothetical protein
MPRFWIASILANALLLARIAKAVFDSLFRAIGFLLGRLQFRFPRALRMLGGLCGTASVSYLLCVGLEECAGAVVIDPHMSLRLARPPIGGSPRQRTSGELGPWRRSNTRTILQAFTCSALQFKRAPASICSVGSIGPGRHGGVMKKAKAKKAKSVTKKASPSDTLGCCTITYENKKDEQVAGVTKTECTRLEELGGLASGIKGLAPSRVRRAAQLFRSAECEIMKCIAQSGCST